MLKIFKVDDYHAVAAENIEDAKKFYIDELEGTENDFIGDEVDPDKSKVWFPTEELPKEYSKLLCQTYDGIKFVEVTKRVAMEHRKDKPPYLLSVSSELL